MRNGTAIGALDWEAQFAESSAEFVHKLSIALKEAIETEYWLLLLTESKYFPKDKMEPIIEDNVSIIKNIGINY